MFRDERRVGDAGVSVRRRGPIGLDGRPNHPPRKMNRNPEAERTRAIGIFSEGRQAGSIHGVGRGGVAAMRAWSWRNSGLRRIGSR